MVGRRTHPAVVICRPHGVPVAVAGEELVGGQLGEGGEEVVHGAGHGADEGLVGGLEMLEAAGAGGGIKEAGAGRGLGEGGVEVIEEGAAGVSAPGVRRRLGRS